MCAEEYPEGTFYAQPSYVGHWLDIHVNAVPFRILPYPEQLFASGHVSVLRGLKGQTEPRRHFMDLHFTLPCLCPRQTHHPRS